MPARRRSGAIWRRVAYPGGGSASPAASSSREHRDGEGRWRRFPFHYTLLALSEMGGKGVSREIEYAAPVLERILKRRSRGGQFETRRRAVAERILARPSRQVPHVAYPVARANGCSGDDVAEMTEVVMGWRWAVLLAGLVLLGDVERMTHACPGRASRGKWDLIAYADHGVWAVTSGIAAFGADGDFTVAGTVTFPMSRFDTLDLSGTWSMSSGSCAILTTTDGSEMGGEFSGADRADPDRPCPPTVIRLCRRT